MKKFAIAAVSLLLAAQPQIALAHHTFISEFDPQKPMAVSGAVTRFDWRNPHARIYVAVKTRGAPDTVWEIAMGSPNTLVRFGWKRDSVKVGDHISADGYRARDGSFLMSAKAVKFANGAVFDAGSSYQQK